MKQILNKKEVLLQIIENLKDLNLSNLMLIKTDGTLLANNFPKNAINYIKKIIEKYKGIKVNNYVRANVANNLNLILYKISKNIFLISLSNENEHKLVRRFKEISQKYNYILFELFKPSIPKSAPIRYKYIKYIVYSKADNLGPNPISWTPESIDEQERFEIAAKSILVLSAGFDQPSRKKMDHMTSIIPFVNYDCIGLVYTFSIFSPRARGNSFDATITLLIPQIYKKLLLNKLDQVEMELKEATKQITGGRNPKYVLEVLRDSIEQIMSIQKMKPQSQTLDSTLKQIMISEIRKIQEKRPYSTLLY